MFNIQFSMLDFQGANSTFPYFFGQLICFCQLLLLILLFLYNSIKFHDWHYHLFPYNNF